MNNPQEMASRRRRTREEVGRLVSQFQASGMSAADFCRLQKLAPSTLRRRLKKQRVPQAKAETGVRLLAVKVHGAQGPAQPEGAPSPTLEVILRSGRRIGVAPAFEAATLSRLVRLLEDL